MQPNNAIFIKNRMVNITRYHDIKLKVVAPIPFFPRIKIVPRWYRFSQIKRYELIEGIDVYHPRYLVTPKIGMVFYGLNMFWGSLRVVKKIYKTFPFELIDAHYIYPDGFAAILLGKILNKPVVLSARGTDINYYPKFKSIRKIIQYTLKNSSSVISVCSSLKDIMIELEIPKEKINVIPNGIDQNKFYKVDKIQARLKVGCSLPIKDKIILSVGGLIERKGHHILIDAISLLKKNNGLNCCAYIIGEGNYKNLLEEKIKKLNLQKNVYLVGQVPNNELVYWYNSVDLFFLGSDREGWPNVISESLACGVPVVATYANGIPEIIISDDYGILVKRTAQDFARGLQQALEKKWDYEKIYQYGQKRTWETVAGELYQVFKKTLCE